MRSTKLELRFDEHYYDISTWVSKHPGGKVIEFYAEKGEDASVAIRQFHQRSMSQVMSIMKSLNHRPPDAKDNEEADPSIERVRHKALSEDFNLLHNEFEKQGYFRPSTVHICYRLLELFILASIGIYWIQKNEWGWCKAVGIVFFALFQGRSGWLMHECGHYSLTGNTKVDRIFLSIIMGFNNGLSGTWWLSQHNRHHAMPQRLNKDVDLETLPLVAFHAKVTRGSSAGKSFFVRNQAFLFLAVDTFLALAAWRIYSHPRCVLRKKNYLELLLMLLHYVVFTSTVGIIPYLVSTWLLSIYTFGNFSLSHSHLPVTESSLHWVEYAFLHTINIEPSWWCDWWMGYLNYQIEHHLFPCMPQFRHPQVRVKVKEFALRHRLPYNCVSYAEAVKRSLKNLTDVSKQLGSETLGEHVE